MGRGGVVRRMNVTSGDSVEECISWGAGGGGGWGRLGRVRVGLWGCGGGGDVGEILEREVNGGRERYL